MIKSYKTGQQFLTENNSLLKTYPLETVFFEVNAKVIERTNDNDFLAKVYEGDKFLIAVHNSDYPMVIFGDNSLCAGFARQAVSSKLTFGKVLGALDTCEAFLCEYERLTGTTHEINHAMDIMQCGKPNLCDTDSVEWAAENDLDEIALIVSSFETEAMGKERVLEHYKQRLQGKMSDFVLIRRGGKIVSMAAKSRETEQLCAISWVYTSPQYRNQGLSCKIVTYLTQSITDSGRLAYLFVDKTNPISNHLYTKIGFTYAAPQYEIKILRNK